MPRLDSGAAGAGIRESVKRKMELDMNDVASNCFFVSDDAIDDIVHNYGDGTDGLILGFASNMNNIGAIPEETFMHVSSPIAEFFNGRIFTL